MFSPYLLTSPHISPHLPTTPHISPFLTFSGLVEALHARSHGDHLPIFPDAVFCLTPRGQTIRLPKGGTPLDFAYAIHTTLGNNCIKALVNGSPQPLDHRLTNGDLVEIVISQKERPAVQKTWERTVVTGRARSEIKRVLNQRARQAAVVDGQRMLASELNLAGVAPPSDKEVLRAARALPSSPSRLAHIHEVYTSLSRGQIAPRRLIAVLKRNSAKADRSRSKQRGTPIADPAPLPPIEPVPKAWGWSGAPVATSSRLEEVSQAAADAADTATAETAPTADTADGADEDGGVWEGVQGSVEFIMDGGRARWAVHLTARLVAEASSAALGSLAREVLDARATVVGYSVRERDAHSIWVDVTVELDEPHQLQPLLTSLRTLPHVERVSKREMGHATPPPESADARASTRPELDL